MIAKSAEVSKEAKIGKNVKIWANSVVREGVKIGDDVVIGGGVYIDHDVTIGSRVKIQNNALLYFGCEVENEVFIGPAAVLANDKYPRATRLDGRLKKAGDWSAGKIRVHRGASIGAGAVILPNVEIGFWVMVGAGAVVTKSIPNFAVVFGNSTKVKGLICPRGHIDRKVKGNLARTSYFCKICHKTYRANGQ